MRNETKTLIMEEVFVLHSTPTGYVSQHVTDARNSDGHKRAVMDRANEALMSSSEGLALLLSEWRTSRSQAGDARSGEDR